MPRILTLLILAALVAGCSSGTTDPPPSPRATTLSYSASGFGMIDVSGDGAWPPSGSGALARIESGGVRLQIAAYRQTFGTLSAQVQPTAAGGSALSAGPEPRFDFLFFEVDDRTLTAGSVYSPGKTLVGFDAALANLDSLGYGGTTGTVSLSEVSATRVSGTFSFTAVRESDSAAVTVTGGTFDLPWSAGEISLDDTAGAGGSITVTAGAGLTPLYAWPGGQVYAVGVSRAATPASLVWGILTAGGDSIASGVTHGMVPAGAMLVTGTEPILTAGVAYRVTVSRVGGASGYRVFVP